MRCPKCGAKLKCIDSRGSGNTRIRKYKCGKCGFEDYTKEQLK